MIKSVGERNMERQEVMHQVLGLKIYRNTFQVISISLDNSNQCNLSRNKVKVDESDLEHYEKRLKHGKEFMWINLVEYFSKNPVKTSISSQKKKNSSC